MQPPGTLADGSPAPTSLAPTSEQYLCGSIQAVFYQLEALLDPNLGAETELLGLFVRLRTQLDRVAPAAPEQLAASLGLLSSKVSKLVADVTASFEATSAGALSPKLRFELTRKQVDVLVADDGVMAAREALSEFVTSDCHAPAP